MSRPVDIWPVDIAPCVMETRDVVSERAHRCGATATHVATIELVKQGHQHFRGESVCYVRASALTPKFVSFGLTTFWRCLQNVHSADINKGERLSPLGTERGVHPLLSLYKGGIKLNPVRDRVSRVTISLLSLVFI